VLYTARWARIAQSVWQSGDRILVRMRFSTPVQTGTGAYPTSYMMGTGSFLGVKQPGCGFDHLPPSSNEVKKRAELHLYSPSGPSCTFPGCTLSFTFIYGKL